MVLPLPSSLSPSKMASFSDCALAFRLSAIDKLPEPPSEAATRGTTVHYALQYLMELPAPERTVDAAHRCADQALGTMATHEDYTGLDLTEDAAAAFTAEVHRLVDQYLVLEDPTTVEPIGLEMEIEAEVGGITVRGIIDRLERDADGGLVVVDYKSGRAPSERFEKGRLNGVQTYAMLCEETLGERPAAVKLMYLRDPVTITARPSDQSDAGLRKRMDAMWTAIERACERESFGPRPGKLCDWCGFHAYCPAQGGDLSAVPVPAPTVAAS